MPPLNELEREELAVLVQCDGKRSVHEIADMLGMSIGKLLSKIQKHTSPTIAAISGRLLLTALIAEIRIRFPTREDAVKRLFEWGVFCGGIWMAESAKPDVLRKLWPKDENPDKICSFIETIGQVAWYLQAGYVPKVETKVVDFKEGFAVKAVIIDDNPQSTMNIDVPYPHAIAAGGYEGANNSAYNFIEILDKWYALWRPLYRNSTRVLVGYTVQRKIPLDL